VSPWLFTHSLHDALPIYLRGVDMVEKRSSSDTPHSAPVRLEPSAATQPRYPRRCRPSKRPSRWRVERCVSRCTSVKPCGEGHVADRKSTRLNSSHVKISY